MTIVEPIDIPEVPGIGDPFDFPDPWKNTPLVQDFQWHDIYQTFNNVYHTFWADVETLTGANLYGFEAQQLAIDRNVVVFMHATNLKIGGLTNMAQQLFLDVMRLGMRTDQQYLNLVNGQVAILDLIAGLMAGTLPGAATLNTPQLEQVQAMIDAQVVPLRENLGELTAQVQQLRTDVNTLRTAPAPNNLDARVSTIESFLGVTLGPLLVGLTALLGSNLPARMATEEECCATNTGFKNEWADLLNKLKPLLKMLSLLDTAALLALLEHIWSEGLPGFIKEVEGIIDDHLSDVENVVGPFLGL